MKEQTGKLNFVKLKNSAKQLMKWQTIDWEKLFAKPVSDKGFVSKKVKNSQNLTIKNHSNFKRSKDLNGHLIRNDIQIIKKMLNTT